MGVHLLKLCVGAESLEDLQRWSAERLFTMRQSDPDAHLFHVTRMVPKRGEELLEGGSLYWVIKGKIQARQTLLDIVTFRDDEGIKRCRLMLDDHIIPTQWQPKRAFQGWRYLKAEDAPADGDLNQVEIPEELRVELDQLGLL